jgi:hypothetical protein
MFFVYPVIFAAHSLSEKPLVTPVRFVDRSLCLMYHRIDNVII